MAQIFPALAVSIGCAHLALHSKAESGKPTACRRQTTRSFSPWPVSTFCKVDFVFWSYFCVFWIRNISKNFRISHIIFQVGHQFCSFHGCGVVWWWSTVSAAWQGYPTLCLSLLPLKWMLYCYISSAPKGGVSVLFGYNAVRTLVLLC